MVEEMALTDMFGRIKRKHASRPGLAYDIDCTLADTRAHFFELMWRYFPVKGTDVQELQRKHYYVEHVPDWQSNPAALDQIREFRTSNEFQDDIPLLDNSPRYLWQIHLRIPTACYATGRPEVVLPGTERWLARHEFPQAPVLIRPHHEPLQRWVYWKAELLTRLFPEVLGIIEDDPRFPDAAHDVGYQGKIFLVGQERYEGRHQHTVACPSWKEVVQSVTYRNF